MKRTLDFAQNRCRTWQLYALRSRQLDNRQLFVPELNMGPFFQTRSNPIHGWIQSMSNSDSYQRSMMSQCRTFWNAPETVYSPNVGHCVHTQTLDLSQKSHNSSLSFQFYISREALRLNVITQSVLHFQRPRDDNAGPSSFCTRRIWTRTVKNSTRLAKLCSPVQFRKIYRWARKWCLTSCSF